MPRKPKPIIGQPPADIAGDPDLLAEWTRIVAAAVKAGHTLKPADNSILALYVRTWSANRKCYEHVAKFGSVIKWPNGIPGASPQYKVFVETAKLLRGLLADLGCTPAARGLNLVESPAKAAEPFSDL
jgi:P27 family predicted phage terminase small subunit